MRFLAVAGLMLTLGCHAVMADSKVGPLTGVKEVAVVINLIHNAPDAGLSKDALKSAVETKLANAGISVLKYGEKSKYGGPGLLVITVDIVKWTGNPVNAYNTRGDFMEQVVVQRASKPFIEDGGTWQYADTGIVGDLTVKDIIGQEADLIADVFLAEYAKDNPKS